jgi:uncharacterized membrane protein YphA (DoxX/SURF4 family)
MELFSAICQVLVGVSVLNVWLIRSQKSTPYRGGNARTIFEEFDVYGLPAWSVYVIGASKVVLAVFLLAGLWIQQLATIGGVGMAVFMLGAVAMHIKVQDPIKKSMPAAIFLLLSLVPAIWGPGNLLAQL